MNPIYIHKSDSTIFANVNKFLTFNLETDLDLTGWQAKFILGWVEKTIDDISTHSFEIILGAGDTKQLRLGKQYGTIILTDSNGNIKTVTNTIPFEVTTAVVENEYQEIDLTIPESSGVDIKLRVGASTVTSVNGMTGDVVLEIPSIEGLATEKQLEDGLDTKQDKGNYAIVEDIPDLTDYVKNTDYSTGDKAGVCKWRSTYGIAVNKDGFIYVVPPSDQQIIDKTNYLLPIIPSNLDLAVKTGVTTNAIELTADEKANAKQWLGYADNTDIMQAIASIPQFNLSIVNELPLTGEKMTLYLVPKEGTNNDVYDEYIWIEQTSSFEHLGTTAVDLTDYVKNTDYASSSKAGVVKTNVNTGVSITSGLLYVAKATDDEVKAKTNLYKPIVPSNLDLAVKTGVTTNTIELTDDEKASARTWLGAVGNTDVAVGNKAGLIKPTSYYCTNVDNGGAIHASPLTLEQYQTKSIYSFVGKGTLDNVLTQYSKTVLTTEADYEALETKDANTLYLIEE